MPSCILRSCKNNIKKLNKSHGITYHQFPAAGPRRDEWVEIIRNERNQLEWNPTRHTRICSAHFKDEDKYVASCDRVYLSKTAVPVINENLFVENLQNNLKNPFNVFNYTKSGTLTSSALGFCSKLELHGRIQQLLIQKMVLTEKCKTWKQKCMVLQRRLYNMKHDSVNNGRDTTNMRRRSTLKWIESEVLGI